jgi:hypothetical protein
MSSHVVERAATSAEQAALEKMLAGAPATSRRLKQGVENALVLWATSLLGVVVVWLAIAWLGRKLVQVDFGMHGPAALWVLGVAIPLCGIFAVRSSIRWVKGWKDYWPQLSADIATAIVFEEHYILRGVKRFQEPEHGGLMYFLLTTEDKVLTLFDHESQDLAMQDGDPLKSGFLPMAELVMVRAPKTGFVIDKKFSGESLEVPDPVDLQVSPENWPESEGYCNIPWAELESRLGLQDTGHAT